MLNDNALRRYARNIALKEIGLAGQEALGRARVLVIGAGGLGSASIAYLAAAGVGTIGIVDDDRVELSNLQRQILHETGDIGRLKVQSAEDAVQELNPEVSIVPHAVRITPENAGSLIRQYDAVADGCDNFATRFAVNAACHLERKPLVSAAVRAFEGQLAVFTSYLGPPHPCYRCFVGADAGDERGCNDAGVLGAVTGIMGSMQALEVIKTLLQLGEPLTGHLLQIELLSLQHRRIKLTRDPQCSVCGR